MCVPVAPDMLMEMVALVPVVSKKIARDAVDGFNQAGGLKSFANSLGSFPQFKNPGLGVILVVPAFWDSCLKTKIFETFAPENSAKTGAGSKASTQARTSSAKGVTVK